MTNAVNIDVSKYLEEKAAGTAALVKLNGVVHYTSRSYDQKTGKPVPTLVPMDQAALEAALKKAQDDVNVFSNMLEDFKNAPEKLA